ncbi:tetratricopeptide repeat protein, partial [Planctomycetota bacterium]
MKKKTATETDTKTIIERAQTITQAWIGDDSDFGSEWHPGQVLEKQYRIERVIARGGIGIVYQALDLATNSTVVIKSLLPSMAQDKNARLRFVREADEWAGLGVHPNIVRVHTVHEIEFLPRIIAEYVDGQALDEFFQAGRLPFAKALDIATQICWGIAFAHDKGIVHRDIKPANVMVSQSGEVKVTDFGLVKRLTDTPAKEDEAEEGKFKVAATLMTEGILGTPEYMAPEQWQGNGKQAADIYAFGVLLYELFLGKRPFAHPELKSMARIMALQDSHYRSSPPDPAGIEPNLPVALVELIRQSLAKKEYDRPESFRIIAGSLNAIAVAGGFPVCPEPSPSELDKAAQLEQAFGYLRLGKGCQFRGDFDKAMVLYEKASNIFKAHNDESGIGSYYRAVVQIKQAKGEFSEAEEMIKKSLQIAVKQDNQVLIGYCYHELALNYQDTGQLDLALKTYEDALRIKQATDDQDGIALCYVNIGNIYKQRGEFDRAIIQSIKALEIAEKFSYIDIMSACFKNMGLAFEALGKFDDSIEMYNQGLKIDRVLGNQQGVASIYNNMGLIFENTGKYSKALEMYNCGLEIAEEIGHQVGICICLINVGSILIQRDKYEQAMQVYQRVQQISEGLGEKVIVMHSHKGVGDIYLAKQEYESAMEMFQKSLDYAKVLNDKRMIGESLFAIGKTYSKLDQKLKALQILKESLDIMEEIGFFQQKE